MDKLINQFKKTFKADPSYLLTAPSRANLSGAHVDYFEGVTVSIASSNLVMKALVRPRDDGKVRLCSIDLDNKTHILDEGRKRAGFQSLEYLQGDREAYKKRRGNNMIKGFNILISSSIPIGGGMSSSSALSVIGATAFSLANDFILNKRVEETKDDIITWIGEQDKKADQYLEEIAHIAGEAEWWYGTKGGKMDQFTISLAKDGQAFILDNRNFTYSYASWPEDSAIAVCNTNVPHDQKKSGFANRREQAEKAFSKIKKYFKDKKIETFRDVSLDMLEEVKGSLSSLEYKRALHPVSEMEERAPKFIKALNNRDSVLIGKILSQTYYSLRDNYGTSCTELDTMYSLAEKLDGFLGARITGGGFGGCLVALVERDKLDCFLDNIGREYNNHKEIKERDIKGKFVGLVSGRGLNIKTL